MSPINRFTKNFHFPFAHYRIVSSIAFILLFIAFILLLLVGISLPIIKPVYLLSLQALVVNQPVTSIATELRFGVWGVCATSALNPTTGSECFGPKLGYTIPDYLFPLVGLDQSVGVIIIDALLVILILHPIAAGLSFLSQFFAAFLGSHSFAIVSLVFAIAAALLGTVVFVIDLAVVLVAKSKVNSLTQFHLTIQWGNGVWMVLVGVVCTWAGVLFLSARACYCCGVRKRSSYGEKDGLEKTG